MSRFLELFQRIDWMLLTVTLTLTSIGLIAIYGIGVSQEPADMFLFQKQFVTALIGCLLIVLLTLFDYRHLRAYGLIFYLIGAALLLGVLVLGVEVNGTQGWFRIGILSFQPIEVATTEDAYKRNRRIEFKLTER